RQRRKCGRATFSTADSVVHRRVVTSGARLAQYLWHSPADAVRPHVVLWRQHLHYRRVDLDCAWYWRRCRTTPLAPCTSAQDTTSSRGTRVGCGVHRVDDGWEQCRTSHCA